LGQAQFFPLNLTSLNDDDPLLVMDEMYDNNQRQCFFKKSQSLEKVLIRLNDYISQPPVIRLKLKPTKPIILIMGCARSGSTLLMQWLCSLGLFSYPSNLIARFYKNPYLGILVQQALLEFDPLNQIGFENAKINESFDSNLGRTHGALAPSEYWYFWRQFFNFSGLNMLSDFELSKVDHGLFLSQLASFENLISKPLLMKGMMLNWHIPYLYSIYSKFFFINIQRDPLFNAQSLLLSREKFFGDKEKWYSFKPAEYEYLKSKCALEQVAGQVIFTQRTINKGLKAIPEQNYISINYESFCANPVSIFNKIKKKYEFLSREKLATENVIFSKNFFSGTNKQVISDDDFFMLKNFVSKYTNLISEGGEVV